MLYPLSVNDEGIHIKPEDMAIEKLYHCFYKEKLILVFKDVTESLNCYEVEDSVIIENVRNSNQNDVGKILEKFIQENNLKI